VESHKISCAEGNVSY